jgi:hypothetical protein
MKSRDCEAREIQRRIGDLLLRHWDPIGVKDEPKAQAEYDSYVGGVYRLLVSGASAKEIAKHLVDIETRQLGFEDTDPKMLIPLAYKLKRLKTGRSSPGPASPVRSASLNSIPTYSGQWCGGG